MKNIKAIIVYVILIAVIGLAFWGVVSGGVLFNKNKNIVSTQGEEGQVQNSEEVSAEEKEEADSSELVLDIPEEKLQHIEAIMAKSTVIETENPIVGLGTGEDYDTVTREAINNAGGLDNVIKEGDTVIIKPNQIKFAEPGDGIITHYQCVQTIADMAYEAGAGKVIVAEASPNGNIMSLEKTGYPQITGVEFVDMNEINIKDCYELVHESSPTGAKIAIPKIYMDADVVITAAKLKTHYEATLTLGLKNSFGVPPTSLVGTLTGKYNLHYRGIANSIVDINLIRKPDFTVIDGIIGGEGNMPLNGTPVDSQVMIAGKDIVATDTVAAAIMGYTVDEVEHIVLAGEYNLGINDLESINVVGANIEDIKMEFAPSLSY